MQKFKIDRLADSIPIYVISAVFHGWALLILYGNLDYSFDLYNLHDFTKSISGIEFLKIVLSDGKISCFIISIITMIILLILNKI